MKRRLPFLLCITVSLFSSSCSSLNRLQPCNDCDIYTVSSAMTVEQASAHLADQLNCSYDEAYTELFTDETVINTAASSPSLKIRELQVSLPITSTYQPTLSFYCLTSECRNNWGIVSIIYTALNRRSGLVSRQYCGSLVAWLRSPYQIEYAVNGDFHTAGRQTAEASISGNYSLDETIVPQGTVFFESTGGTSDYYYVHHTVDFQS